LPINAFLLTQLVFIIAFIILFIIGLPHTFLPAVMNDLQQSVSFSVQ
jgi:hypothetical protein